MLHRADLADRARIIMEKPFGRRTSPSSREQLNETLHETFDEKQIFRIDHFLGKEAALNILAFRFTNGLLGLPGQEQPGVRAHSETETFIALQVRDRQLALGRRAVLPAHRQAHGRGRADHLDRVPRAAEEHVPAGLGRRRPGPDHLTFDLADASKLSLSFYGKRPGPGMKLDKLSLQFALHETGGPPTCSRPTSG